MVKFNFKYIGNYNHVVSKKDFEDRCKYVYHDIKSKYKVAYTPSAINIIFKTKNDERAGSSWGGTCSTDLKKRTFQILFEIRNKPPEQQDRYFTDLFFKKTIVHEFFHFFLLNAGNSVCWGEGVVEFMMAHYTHNLAWIPKLMTEYKNIKVNNTNDAKYKKRKYPYAYGSMNMLKLYKESPRRIHNVLASIIRDMCASDESFAHKYTAAEIIAYAPEFKIFFTKQCLF